MVWLDSCKTCVCVCTHMCTCVHVYAHVSGGICVHVCGGRQVLHLSVTPTPPQQQPSTWEPGNDCPWKGATSPRRRTSTTASFHLQQASRGQRRKENEATAPKRKLRKQYKQLFFYIIFCR